MALVTSPWSGVMKIGRFWRISRSEDRRFLLRDGFMMAAVGMHPPFYLRAGLRIRVRVRLRAVVGVVRSSGSQYAAAGTDTPCPPAASTLAKSVVKRSCEPKRGWMRLHRFKADTP